jgi:carboxypeptidase C (cathepsin A)
MIDYGTLTDRLSQQELRTSWTTLFPEFAGREVILSSESYGGHYVPAWANAVNDHNDAAAAPADKINLKGLVIGNGIVNETVQSDTLYYEFLKSHDLIPATAKPLTRGEADLLAEKHIGYESNYYDFRIKSYNYTNWAAWFTRPEVKTGLNVCGDAGNPAFEGAGAGCIDFPNGFDRHDKFDYSGALARSLDRGIAVSFYYGKADRACNYVGGYAMAKALEWKGQAAFVSAKLEPLMIGAVEGGQVQKSGLLTFVQVDAAGHMVPMDQPAASSWVIDDLMTTIKH